MMGPGVSDKEQSLSLSEFSFEGKVKNNITNIALHLQVSPLWSHCTWAHYYSCKMFDQAELCSFFCLLFASACVQYLCGTSNKIQKIFCSAVNAFNFNDNSAWSNNYLYFGRSGFWLDVDVFSIKTRQARVETM